MVEQARDQNLHSFGELVGLEQVLTLPRVAALLEHQFHIATQRSNRVFKVVRYDAHHAGFESVGLSELHTFGLERRIVTFEFQTLLFADSLGLLALGDIAQFDE